MIIVLHVLFNNRPFVKKVHMFRPNQSTRGVFLSHLNYMYLYAAGLRRAVNIIFVTEHFSDVTPGG